ncbi:Protein KTI12-like protein, partial [Bienertia sinuspersici]
MMIKLEGSFALNGSVVICGQPYSGKSTATTRMAVPRDSESEVTVRNIDEIDSLNSIKGYRYELWCLARAAGVRYRVLYCDVEEIECRKWNEDRKDKGELTYDEIIFENLVKRFEKPDTIQRWIFKSSPDIVDDVSYLTKKIDSKTRDVILQPTIATQSGRHLLGNSLYELDHATQEMMNVTLIEAKEKRLKNLVKSGNYLVKKFKKHKDQKLSHEMHVAQ